MWGIPDPIWRISGNSSSEDYVLQVQMHRDLYLVLPKYYTDFSRSCVIFLMGWNKIIALNPRTCAFLRSGMDSVPLLEKKRTFRNSHDIVARPGVAAPNERLQLVHPVAALRVCLCKYSMHTGIWTRICWIQNPLWIFMYKLSTLSPSTSDNRMYTKMLTFPASSGCTSDLKLILRMAHNIKDKLTRQPQ